MPDDDASLVGDHASSDISILRRSEFRAVSQSCELLAYSYEQTIFPYTQYRSSATLKMEKQNED